MAENNILSRVNPTFIFILFGLVTLACFTDLSLLWEEEEAAVYSKEIPSPQFNKAAGIYQKEFNLKLSAANGLKIYYTTDGSLPTLKSNLYSSSIPVQKKANGRKLKANISTSIKWKPPVHVDQGVLVRAAAYNTAKGKFSQVTTRFYRIGKKAVLPTVSVAANPDDLFSLSKGIYVPGNAYLYEEKYHFKQPWWEKAANYHERGKEWERQAHISFFNPNGQLEYEADCGLRINGNATRSYPQKSLRLLARKELGPEPFQYAFFENNSYSEYASLLLRNSGNDWDRTMFGDGLMQRLATGFNAEMQAYKPHVVYLNGEYWGIHNLRERIQEDYLSIKYNVSQDDICILENEGELDHGSKADEKDFMRLMKFVKANHLKNPANYEKVASEIDVDNLMDYMIAQIFFANSDWPKNNQKFYRIKAKSEGHGKWRWVLSDTDYGFGYTGNPDAYQLDMFGYVLNSGTNLGLLFKRLLRNEAFKANFKLRFEEALATSFSTKHMLKTIKEMKAYIEPEIEQHLLRWRKPSSKQQWEANIKIFEEFAKNRPKHVKKHLSTYLK
jgi:hypothetical protein